jgi:hypothetical protein
LFQASVDASVDASVNASVDASVDASVNFVDQKRIEIPTKKIYETISQIYEHHLGDHLGRPFGAPLGWVIKSLNIHMQMYEYQKTYKLACHRLRQTGCTKTCGFQHGAKERTVYIHSGINIRSNVQTAAAYNFCPSCFAQLAAPA